MKTESHPVSVPFSITPDAEDYLRDRLNGMPSKAHPVLMMTMYQSDGLNPPRWCYEGRSFILGYFDSTEKAEVDYTESELLGRRVAVESSALKQLSGRTLKLCRVASSRGLMNISRYVLVADSNPEEPDPRFEMHATPEQTKRVLSIVTLTILGGFTGMGVIWIVSAKVVSILKIPFEQFLPLTFPLFAAGWIIGAIISFVFFRSVFKTTGRTKFAQEKQQIKYLGYSGLGVQMNWWIFLGIPILLTGILVFVFWPFARTAGEKSGLVFGAIMVIFTASMYFCDRLPRRLVLRLGVLGWALAFALGYWYFKTHGP